MKYILLLLSFSGQIVFADELMMSLEEAKRQGFKSPSSSLRNTSPNNGFQNSRLGTTTNRPATLKNKQAHQVSWPFELPYSEGFIGNNMAQYQPYETPGYHGGLDMVLESDSWVYAPLDGKVEAGHYSYTSLDDGSHLKHWKPWPASGNETYFEVAVIDRDGYRYEFHHINRATLPAEIIAGLDAGNLAVAKGQKIGQVINWMTPFHYDHVHANVIDPRGVVLNPEYIYQLLPDHLPPQCKIVAQLSNGSIKAVDANFKLTNDVINFVVIGSDQKDGNKFSQAPLYYELIFNNGVKSILDFRKGFTTDDGSVIDIRKIYPQTLQMPDGTRLKQPTGYYPNKVTFLVNIPLPIGHNNQSFVLKVADISGNNFVLKYGTKHGPY